jgi:hypothetical protein
LVEKLGSALNPFEALKHIRTLVEGPCEKPSGTRAEPIIREIRGILEKALPPKGRRRTTMP